MKKKVKKNKEQSKEKRQVISKGKYGLPVINCFDGESLREIYNKYYR